MSGHTPRVFRLSYKHGVISEADFQTGKYRPEDASLPMVLASDYSALQLKSDGLVEAARACLEAYDRNKEDDTLPCFESLRAALKEQQT